MILSRRELIALFDTATVAGCSRSTERRNGAMDNPMYGNYEAYVLSEYEGRIEDIGNRESGVVIVTEDEDPSLRWDEIYDSESEFVRETRFDTDVLLVVQVPLSSEGQRLEFDGLHRDDEAVHAELHVVPPDEDDVESIPWTPDSLPVAVAYVRVPYDGDEPTSATAMIETEDRGTFELTA